MTDILNILHTSTTLLSLRMKGFNFKERNLNNIPILFPHLKESGVRESWVSWITRLLTKEMQNLRILTWMQWNRMSLTKCVQQFSSHHNSNRACICNAYWHWHTLLAMETFKNGPLHSIGLQYLPGTPHYTKAFVWTFLMLPFSFPLEANLCSWITAHIKFFAFHLEYKLIINLPTNFKSNIPLTSTRETEYTKVFRGFLHHFTHLSVYHSMLYIAWGIDNIIKCAIHN